MKKNRGLVFGGTSSGMGNRMRAVNPYRTMSNMPSQFGRSAGGSGKATLYGKPKRLRRT